VSAVKKPSASVTASGVIAIAGSVLVLLGGAMGLLGMLMAPMNRVNPPLPPLARAMAEVTVAFILGLGVFGALSGIGLLRLKNWARISTLVWSGVTVVISTLVLVAFAVAPFPPSLNAPPNFAGIMRAALLIFYGLPLAIGIWWLILFNRQSVANQFVQPAGGPLDTYGSPVEGLSASRPTLPLPIAVFGVFLVFSSVCVVLPSFLPVPVILFGHAIRGAAETAVWVGFGLATLAAGTGLLRLKRWSYDLAFGLQLFWLLSGIVTLTSGNYAALMHEAMSSIQAKFGGEYPEYPPGQMMTFSYAGLAVPVLILALLVYYRSRFLQASASRTKPA
jgi:hypothetical protein